MYQIHSPTLSQVGQVRLLNDRHLISHLTEAQRQGGFVRVAYNPQHLASIIRNREILVATFGEEQIGYYLVGRTSGNPALDYQKEMAGRVSATKEIPVDKIGYGCQVCIDDAHRANGLFGELFAALVLVVQEKYSHLLCSISVENPVSVKAHLKYGWQLFDTINHTHFFLFELNKTKPQP